MSNKSIMNGSSKPGFFGELWQQGKLVFQLILDPKVPIYLKAVPFAAIAYLIFPFDFLPDVIPGLGQLDDIGILLLGAKLFIELAPQDVVASYLGRVGSSGQTEDLKGSSANDGDQQDGDDVIEGIVIEDTDVSE